MPGYKDPQGLKICLLGGLAKMAIPALRELAGESGLQEVLLADLDGKAAAAKADELGGRFTGRGVDANDENALVELLRGYDIALGYIGPFYHFEKKIAAACIAARTHYVSIADDFDAFLAVETLHEEAVRAGVTVISGLGNSPGITNLLAKKGYLSMDKPERINVQWTGGSDEEVGPANVRHVMHIFAGHTPQWMDGREVMVRCGEGEKMVEFPAPIGFQTVFYTGHAESVSIPRYLKGLKEVTLHGGVRPVWVARLAHAFGRAGLTTTPKRRDLMTRLLTPMMGVFTMGGSADRSVFRIDVHGSHEGQPRHHVYTGVGPIAEITSMPCVEGALMVARSEIAKRGVFPAEGILDPEVFLPRIAKRGVTLTYYEGKFQQG